MRQLLSSPDAAPPQAAAWLARLDACDRAMRPIVWGSIAFTASNDPSSSASGARSLKPYDVINGLKILTQIDSVHLQVEQPIRTLLGLLPVVVSMATMGEICALVQVLSKARGRDSGNSAIGVLPPDIVLPLFESIRAKLFLMVESHGTRMWPMECSILLSGLSRFEWSSGNDAGIDGGLRASVGNVFIANDMLNLFCVHFTAGADYVGAPQLVPFLQGLARLKSTRSRRHSGKSAAKADTDVLAEHLPILSTTLVKCADIATRLARDDKLSAQEAAHILSLLVQLRFKGCESFYLSVEQLLGSVFNDDLLEGSSGKHRSIHAAVFDAVDQLIVFFRNQRTKFTLKSNGVRSHSHALDCALKLRSRLYNSVLGSVAQAETPKEVIRLLKLLYPSVNTPTPVQGEVDTHYVGNSVMSRAPGYLDLEEIKLLADSEADDEVAVDSKDLLNGDEEGAVGMPTDRDVDLGTLYRAPRARHALDGSLETFARRIEYVSKECSAHELVELSMAVAQLYRSHGLEEASTYRTLHYLLHRASSVSLSVAQYKKLLDALRIAKKGDTVPLHIMKGFSSALAVATAGNPHSEGCCVTEGGCLATCVSLSILEAVAIGRTILASIKQQLKDVNSIAKGPSHTAAQQRNERRKVFMEIGISYTGQCAAAINRFVLNTYPGHLSGSAEELIVLGYILAQLYRILATDHAQGDEFPHKSEAADEVMAGDLPGYDDGDLRLDLVDERDAIYDQNETHYRNTAMLERDFFTFRRGIVEIFNALGDALCPFLERLQLPSEEDGKGFEGSLRKGGNSSTLTADATSDACTIEPKKYVMLMQSFGIVGVVHYNLLYSLLPQIRRLAPCMDPLELSLLMSYLARSGLCSRRILDCLATEIGRHAAKSELRQCHAILRSMQRSGFLSKEAFLWPKRGLVLNADQDIDTLATTHNAKLKSSLGILARAVVERLDSLIAQESQIHDVVRSYSLDDLVGVVHALFFFTDPPQPTFDSYYIISAKKVLVEATRFSKEGKVEPSDQSVDKGEVGERIFLSIVFLASCTHLLRRSHHQVASSRVIAFSLRMLDRRRCLGSSNVLPMKRASKKTTRLRVAHTPFAAFVAKLSDGKLVELLHTSRIHWLLYNVKLLRSESFITDMLLRRLEIRYCSEENNNCLSGSLNGFYNTLDQLARCNVVIPFQGRSLRFAWSFLRFIDHHVLRPLFRTSNNVNGARLSLKGIITLCNVQNYFSCASPRHSNSPSQGGPDGNESPLADLLIPGLRKALLDSISSPRSTCCDGSHEANTPIADLEAMRLSDIASLYLTQTILLSRVDAPGNGKSDDLKIEVDLFMSVSSILISRMELQSLKVNIRSCVDLVLGSCLLLNIELCAGSTYFKDHQSFGSHAVGVMARAVLEKALQALSLKLNPNSHSRRRWVLLEIYRLILGFECVLVRVALAPFCSSATEVVSEVTALASLDPPPHAHHQKEMTAFRHGAADHTINAQEACENALYRVLMTIAQTSRVADGSLLRLGKRCEAHLVSKVRACLNGLAIGQEKGHTTDSRSAQRILQVIRWIEEADNDHH
ncbi:unnamed protein product [Phytomonas sp. EM1]|nr:unnamed protein product [Phytomonas sp. EM1]|eukprot:CCW60041.1 unnamed protein product [Phytomonas sp. isolate EM1]